MYIPGFNVNLISVNKITASGCKIVSTQTQSDIIKNNEILYTFPLINNLYQVTVAYNSSSSYMTQLSTTVSSHTHSPDSQPSTVVKKIGDQIYDLHIKHGHINYNRLMRRIQSNCIKTNIQFNGHRYTNVMKYLRSLTCTGCLKGKHSRLPMTGTINHQANDILDMWVIDTMVPNMPTRSGNKYITLILDVYSGYLILILTKTKSEINARVISTIQQYQTQHQKTIKRLHSDNAKELVNDEIDLFLTMQGTRHTTSLPYTPEHNIVERHNRTVIETMKSMMYHANSPTSLYGDGANTAVYHRNRSINTHSDTKTAYEHMNKHKPDLTHIHVWGCDAYYYTYKRKR